ncbi:14545_t:CDS:1, partial [Dentiscutata heterogama]
GVGVLRLLVAVTCPFAQQTAGFPSLRIVPLKQIFDPQSQIKIVLS